MMASKYVKHPHYYPKTKTNKRPCGGKYRKLRTHVRERDKKCVFCGTNTDLEMHHLKSYKDHPYRRLDPTNVVLLCTMCHTGVHRGGLAEDSFWNILWLLDRKIALKVWRKVKGDCQ